MEPNVTPNLTDVVLFCFLLFLLLDGWRQGIFKSAIGPIIFIFCAILGIIYFDLTQNFIKAIFMTTVATMILNVIFLIMFTLGQRSVDQTYRDYSPLLSRILGGLINMAWQGCILFIIVFLITIAPFQIYGLSKIQNNIQQSYGYFFLVKKGINELPAMQRVVTAFSIFGNSDEMQKLSSTPEFQYFFSNPKVQSLLQDQVFMKYVQKKNIPKIISNPKIWDIFKDDALMETFGKLAGKIYSLNLPSTSPAMPKTNR